MIFDYETLKLIWWVFMAVLLVSFAVTDGFDMGVAALLPFLGKGDEERRVIINTIGATFEGNQTWLITGVGATLAAWPLVYAAAFSGFYIAFILVLFALFLRPVGFDYRSKLDHPTWRNAWDWGLFIGGTVPAFMFGVIVGNLMQGVPFHIDQDMRMFYEGSFWGLFNPFALLAGILSLSMMVMHGAVFLQIRSQGIINLRAMHAARNAAIITLLVFGLAGLWVATGIEGYRIVSMPPADSAFTPLAKVVEKSPGAWLANLNAYPWMIAAPALAFAGAITALAACARGRPAIGLLFSGLSVGAIVATAGLAMFPFIMPSSSHPNASLTLWDAVSSHRTLQIMFWVVLLFLPLIVVYTSWVYRVLRGRISITTIKGNERSLY